MAAHGKISHLTIQSCDSNVALGPSAADQETQRERNERRRKRRAELEAEREAFRAKTAHVIARLRAENLYRMQETSVLAVNTADDTNPAEDQPQAVPQNTPQNSNETTTDQSIAPPVAPPVTPAKLRLRHLAILTSFLLAVIAPIAGVSWYMLTRASDQYVSHLAFSIRTEDAGSALDLLGGLTRVTSNGGTSDTDLLFDYLQSPALVKEINDELDLLQIWRSNEQDPIFRFSGHPTLEALTAYWNRMVKLSYNNSSHILQVRTHAFDPQDAQVINDRILAKSADLINRLSASAREDATRYARDDLDQALDRLKAARSAITRFRSDHLIFDPTADSHSQTSLLSQLQSQLAETMVAHDMLMQQTSPEDPRVVQIRNKIAVIRNRIDQERQNFGATTGADDPQDYAAVLTEYERLSVEKEFAEQAYISALAAYDGARAEASRKTRYVEAHIPPTLPQSATAPDRLSWIALFGIFAFLLWAIAILLFYAVKDRR
nr:hypothetical protein [uncultured Celeribacter sp.]